MIFPVSVDSKLSRILFFVLIRAEIADIGMAVLSKNIEPFDIVKNRHLGFLTGIASFSMNQVHL